MKEIFREADYTRVAFCESILQGEGIQTHIRNKDLVGTLTEVPIPEFFPALCVVNEDDYERAVEILKLRFTEDQERASLPDVRCPKCHEENPATFDVCWSCEAELNPSLGKSIDESP